jgi:sortase A
MGRLIKKSGASRKKLYLRSISLIIVILGAGMFFYTFFPIISWQVYFAPAFASQKIDSPLANSVSFNPAGFPNLLANFASSVTTNYNNAYNWYPGIGHEAGQVVNYKISIPSIGVADAVVSNKDSDLTSHLVQFNSDTFPPKEGNSVIFGHSTLPQLFEQGNYRTVFANAYKIKNGDQIIVNSQGRNYVYKVFSLTVVEPTDTSVLSQDFSDSYITIITCTPPGPIWKRLIIKAKIDR